MRKRIFGLNLIGIMRGVLAIAAFSLLMGFNSVMAETLVATLSFDKNPSPTGVLYVPGKRILKDPVIVNENRIFSEELFTTSPDATLGTWK